ncbi:hypothetical protein GeomeDRAFT_1471 [Geobacter metallireducens RCH3]|uniref:Uncharacterized protein n=1 Tax=Geobacter metallireducens (strain ATCC 53774 / DSM 7210 / GS-15) TaxID=269799 RepID=Q39RJ1_GEOMG|nr:hypothetical protein [Geobacter metallireducens]ABB33133.1 hypothetical protein Gmet_2915 [Geobacter metallireducens GS-15]EHP87132.1 hypothetical protein GeomeDRAFT_1471 [Geobacter metallireducens RCH3]
MKTTLATMITLIAASSAFAASGAESEGSGLFLILFIGIGALIIVGQMLPGLTLFGSMLKGLFSGKDAESRN